MEHKIIVSAQRLTDGSLAYDVKFRDCFIPAVTLSDALELAEKIADAINDHSVDEADVVVSSQERAA